jgi:hypothetical protein
MVVRRYKEVDMNKLLAELQAAEGLNGVRFLIHKYFSKQFRWALAEKSPEFFLMYYMGFRLPDHQKKWIRLWWTVKYLLDCAPRDHGKSWIFSYGRPITEIYTSFIRSKGTSVDARFLQVSKTDEQASKYATQVRETIERSRLLNEDFGNIQDPREWLKDHFRCVRAAGDFVEKDYTYEKVGVLGGITGAHFHTINCDDILDDENTKTVDRMNDIENWFFGTIWNLREPITRIIVVGTRKNRRDLYNTLLQSPVWKHNIERAIIVYPMIPSKDKPGEMDQGWLYITDRKRTIKHPNELKLNEIIVDVELLTDQYKVLWPSVPATDNDGKPIIDPTDNSQQVFGWGIRELLLDRAAQGGQFFDREKQNEISSSEGAIFKAEWFSYFDTEELVYNSSDGYHYLQSELRQ